MNTLTAFSEGHEMFAPLALIIGPFTLLFLGEFIGSRISKGKTQAAAITLMVIALFWALLNLQVQDGGLALLLSFLLPFSAATGLILGLGKTAFKEIYERDLANWRGQLAADRQKDGSQVRLAIDYQKIGNLLAKLGRYEEAFDEYRHGLLIMEIALNGHPVLREYYKGYLRLLMQKSQAEECNRVRAKLANLPAF